MGLCCAKSTAIDELLSKDMAPSKKKGSTDGWSSTKKKDTKLLLLGTGNSGKSTVFKQFQLRHKNGFSDAERKYYRKLMTESAIGTICKLLQNANDLLFEGEMKDEEMDEKGIMIMMKNANAGYETSGDDSERVFFSQAIEMSPSQQHNHKGSTFSIGSRREQERSDLSEAERRRTDLSEYGPVAVRSGSFSENTENKYKESMDEESPKSHRSASKRSSSPIGKAAQRLSNLGAKMSSKDKDKSIESSSLVGEDVAPVAELVRGLPSGTQLYDRFTVTWSRDGEQAEEKELTVAEMLKMIWEDPVIQKVYSMEGKMPSLEAPISYYMEHIDRISQPDFVPTEMDILFSRKQTRTVQELAFRTEGKSFVLIDVGGQRIERRKWVSYFESVDAVLFVVGLDGYNQLCLEDGKTNRLREALALFKEICDSPFFLKTNFLLFLNKCDLFKEKIQHVPLNVCFRSYTGPQHDYDQCVNYIKKRFVDTHTRHLQKHMTTDLLSPRVYAYITSATETEQMNYVIAACQSIFLRKGLAQCGIAAM